MIYRTVNVDKLQEMLNSVTKKYHSMVENIRWHIRVNEPDQLSIDELNKQIQEYNGFINDLKLIEESAQPIPADIKTAEEVLKEKIGEIDYPEFKEFGFEKKVISAMQEYASLNRGEPKIFKCKCGYETSNSTSWSIHADICTT